MKLSFRQLLIDSLRKPVLRLGFSLGLLLLLSASLVADEETNSARVLSYMITHAPDLTEDEHVALAELLGAYLDDFPDIYSDLESHNLNLSFFARLYRSGWPKGYLATDAFEERYYTRTLPAMEETGMMLREAGMTLHEAAVGARAPYEQGRQTVRRAYIKFMTGLETACFRHPADEDQLDLLAAAADLAADGYPETQDFERKISQSILRMRLGKTMLKALEDFDTPSDPDPIISSPQTIAIMALYQPPVERTEDERIKMLTDYFEDVLFVSGEEHDLDMFLCDSNIHTAMMIGAVMLLFDSEGASMKTMISVSELHCY